MCHECLVGKVYKTDPGSFLRIIGHSPFTPEQHVMSRFRCNACGVYTTAPVPENVVADGDVRQKYGYSARALMGIYKYFAGLPFYRQCSIQKLLGVKLGASTVFDQVEFVCNDVHPIFLAMLQHPTAMCPAACMDNTRLTGLYCILFIEIFHHAMTHRDVQLEIISLDSPLKL